jgi:hypothetical protein
VEGREGVSGDLDEFIQVGCFYFWEPRGRLEAVFQGIGGRHLEGTGGWGNKTNTVFLTFEAMSYADSASFQTLDKSELMPKINLDNHASCSVTIPGIFM